ncbi:DUF2202 domain-containing protein [Sulfurimonas sp.]|uniref:ferritin-like domain-containing protein n=1 Tax=Sulfurimonas sp. TaxID=2022749 RepID=UPI002AB0C401|nr:DUF2202 domain-containing protein [Sulfurimonas sp.]
MNPDEEQLLSQQVDTSADVVQQLLRIACYDEYKANAYYQKVIDTYGSVTPFSNIVQAEVRHYTAIEQLCKKYGVTPPINDWYDKIQIGSSLTECCQDGVDAEIANIEMYDKLLPFVMQDDIRDVFYKEQAASYNQHLPAFERCAQNNQANDNQQHHDIYNMVQGLMKGEMDSTKITQALTSIGSRDMMLGMAAGAALAMALSSDASKDVFDKIFNDKDKS